MWFKKHRVLIIVIIGLIIVVRLILPILLLRYLNKELAQMNGYYGHIDDIDLAIYRGAYKVKEIYINKVDSVSGQQTPFFEANLIDLSVEWRALFHGRLAGELELYTASLAFTKDKTDPAKVQKDTTTFADIIDKFMPLVINRFEVSDGSIHYRDPGAKPPVDLQLNQAHILAQNLKNVVDSALLPASIVARANVYGGSLYFNMNLNPLAKTATFDMNADVKNADLTKFNDFFLAYGNFDVHKGRFAMYTEIAAEDGKFVGYVKPIITDLKVLGTEDKKDNLFQKMWEAAVGLAAMILKNPKKDQIATKVPLHGSFSNVNADSWYAVIEVLENAFIQALKPSIDYEINIGSVKNPPKEEKKGFFKKLFSEKKS